MLELNTRLIGLSAFIARGESNARKSLEKHSLEELFNLHGLLNKKSIGYWYRKYHQKVNGLYPVGSFVVADVQKYTEDRVIQIHFIPSDSTKKSTNLLEVDETILLALTDAEEMFNTIEQIHEKYGINIIFGQTKDMALIARRFGFDIRNNKINPYNNIFSTEDIPNFLQHAREKLEKVKPKILERFENQGITEKSARINAVLHFMGKVR